MCYILISIDNTSYIKIIIFMQQKKIVASFKQLFLKIYVYLQNFFRPIHFNYITNYKQLTEFCELLSKQQVIALDTEFHRTSSYFPKLSLVQIALADKTIHIIDIHAFKADINQLAEFFELLNSAQICKVIHSARQDIEALYYYTQQVPENIFDTQIAAQLVGYRKNISYYDLVRKVKFRLIDKALQFSKWDKRPLTDLQLRYAALDVKYSIEIFEYLNAEIKNKKLNLKQRQNKLLAAETYQVNYQLAYKKYKLPYKPHQFEDIKRLTAEREKLAVELNLHRKNICSDQFLNKLLKLKPKTENDLANISIPKQLRRKQRILRFIDIYN